MENRFIFAIMAVISVCAGHAQLSSVLVEEGTNKPLDYANIWVADQSIGTYSDETGHFSINTQSPSDTIVISSVGYETKRIAAKDIKDTIFLRRDIYELTAVGLFRRKNKKKQTIALIKKSEIEYYCSAVSKHPWMLAKYYPYESKYGRTPFISSISLFTMISEDADFNVRIYSVGEDGKPDESLVNDNIAGVAQKGTNKTIVDFSRLNIVFPDTGIFVVIENSKSAVLDSKVTSALGIGLNLKVNSSNTYFYYGGNWVKNIVAPGIPSEKLLEALKYALIELTLSD